MSELSKNSMVYNDTEIPQSVSEVVNEAVWPSLSEAQEDLSAVE